MASHTPTEDDAHGKGRSDETSETKVGLGLRAPGLPSFATRLYAFRLHVIGLRNVTAWSLLVHTALCLCGLLLVRESL